MDIQNLFGGIDIYLFDQIQKGRFEEGMKILDVGCGNGRNLIYLMQSGYEVYGVDESLTFINNIKFLAKQLAPELPESNFSVGTLDSLDFDDYSFDVIISSAVLHFASDENQFLRWLNESWRVLKKNGLLFARLASLDGLEDKVEKIEGRRYHLPDTSDRFLVDMEMLMILTDQLNGELIEPIKTTNVQNLRCMATWCLRKLSSKLQKDKKGLIDSDGLRLLRE
jgi:ubiquinone/menaquinone biosynthesis C-methylase UbiE